MVIGRTFSDELRKFCVRYPVVLEHEDGLLRLDRSVAALPIADFFEPATLVMADQKWNMELMSVEPEDLMSWTRHMAASMSSRMRVLEPPILGNLAEGNILAGMVLLRAHVEAAAMAAYCLEQLTEAGRAQDFERLRVLIAQTLFGTSRVKYRNHEKAEQLTSFGDTHPIRIADALKALDRFFYAEHAEGQIGIAYSLLCEFAHPNHGGARHFVTSTDQPGGWRISYGEQQPLSDEAVVQVIGTLIATMRGGYAAGHMLCCWHFMAEAGGIRWTSPSPEDADRVWETFLQRPIPRDSEPG